MESSFFIKDFAPLRSTTTQVLEFKMQSYREDQTQKMRRRYNLVA